ncbi:MAG: DNA-processing protein DprA [Candidatus Moraniibacteriota bacterium]
MNETLFLHALNTVPGVGGKTLRQLLGIFGSAEAAWKASPDEWRSLPDIGPKTRESFIAHRQTFDFAQAKALLESQSIDIVSFTDTRFPTLLEETPHPPALLYVRGDATLWKSRPLLSIVGSRKYTHYGEQVTRELATELARAGFVIVSGLAFGIDAFAHESTLDANGQTIAVLGSGNDDATLSPQTHVDLAHRILDARGVIITEFAPGTPGNMGTFPARNRIMAGMSLGTIVIEAAEESGSLITARLALDYNREVFAVPGSIFSPVSAGTNGLLKQGAKVVTGIQDILEELAPHLPRAEKNIEHEARIERLSSEEKNLFSLLSHEPLHVDKIIEASKLETTSVNSLLVKLEMQGLVKNIGNMHYIRLQ